jgi:hypothetical protein
MRWAVNNIGLIGAVACFVDVVYLHEFHRRHAPVLFVIGLLNLILWAWRRGKPEWR